MARSSCDHRFRISKRVSNPFPLIRKLKAGPLEAEFERQVEEISREVVQSTNIEIWDRSAPRLEMLRELARVNPRSAVLEAWIGVESAVRRATLQTVATSPAPDVTSTLRAMKELERYEAISAEEVSMFRALRGLRSQVAHLESFNPSIDAALNYVDLASQLESRLERLARVD